VSEGCGQALTKANRRDEDCNFGKRTKVAKAKLAYIKWFREIGIEDMPIVGGKTAFEENSAITIGNITKFEGSQGLEN
jgi:hypothetical protein